MIDFVYWMSVLSAVNQTVESLVKLALAILVIISGTVLLQTFTELAIVNMVVGAMGLLSFILDVWLNWAFS